MNCKKGDLAIFVRSTAGNEGKIVRCLKLAGVIEKVWPCGKITYDNCWLVDPPAKTAWGDNTEFVPDDFLRPIRDADGTDEMLLIAGLPKTLEKV